jgi:hypothetical protein
LDFDIVIVAMMALMVLLLVAGAEVMWRRRGRRAMADAHMPTCTSGTDLVMAVIHHARRPAAGVERGISTIVAVYRTDPVMVVGETGEGALLERSLHELAERHELLPPRLWQELVEQYQIFQIR